MDRIEAMKLLSEIKHYLTAGNPVWDVDEIAEACDMAIEAIKNEINCVKCEHYTERETPTGIKGVCKMDTAHRSDTISRQHAIKRFGEEGTWLERQGVTTLTMVETKQRAVDILESIPSADAVEVVRCKDCKKYETLNYTDRHTGEVSHKYVCKMLKRQMLPRDFCSCGERREDGEA